MSRWLVNDCLGTLGERTHWHHLLGLGLVDKTNGYTDYSELADKIEADFREVKPSVIVRNGTYFRHLNVDCKQIAFVQDIARREPLRAMQAEVIAKCDHVVFNSEYTKAHCLPCESRCSVIPIGVDFELFKPMEKAALRVKWGIKQDSVLWVGAGSKVKGWEFLKQLIEQANFNFVVVTKDGARIQHERVKCFGPIYQHQLAEIMNACSVLVCTSEQETQHLAGIEAAACGLPLVVPNIGIYYDRHAEETQCIESPCFGDIMDRSAFDEPLNFAVGIRHVFDNLPFFRPRQHFLDLGCDTATCMERWKELIQ
jgi:glycosyltransferase involved in cell wall biosynthesis